MSRKVKLDYEAMKDALKEKGFTLAGWARLHDFKPTTVYDSARGDRHGVKAREIRRKLREAIA
ncbi:MAG TPA: hypothetical protein VMB21_14225 [Candidatus Limnocylindria bacterium]|jgi:gp16 family phage-associated protein|nr:hypothetical protein [Candidatus Limnocylindria bacterium]